MNEGGGGIKNNKKFLMNNSAKNNINKKFYFDKNKIMNNKNLNNSIKINNPKKILNNVDEERIIYKNPNVNIKNIIKYKEKKIRPKHKELCHKFTENPQHFFTIKLNELMLKALNIKKNINIEKKIIKNK